VKVGSIWVLAIVALTLVGFFVLVLAAIWAFSSGWDRCVSGGDDSDRVTSCLDSEGSGRGPLLTRVARY